MSALRILHVLRAPVGGLFRHVRDLAMEQTARGHEVGLLADQVSADALTANHLDDLSHKLKLGVHLTPMSRNPGLVDFSVVSHTKRLIERLGAHVVHGHGAKGGAYARLGGTLAAGAPGSLRPARFYTPHGGSLHYRHSPVRGGIYRGLEKVLGAMTDGVLFESSFAAGAYYETIRPGTIASRVVPNGLNSFEFSPVKARADAADFVFVGELRDLKGVDLLVEALGRIHQHRPVSAVVVGDGPDADKFKTLSRNLGLDDAIRFPGAMPAREAFAHGRCFVMPSRAESLPYVALEATAAGLPLVATDVGGVNEIVRGTDTSLVRPNDAGALSEKMAAFLDNEALAKVRAQRLKAAVANRFSLVEMASGIEDFYFDVISRKDPVFAGVPELAN